MNETKPTTQTSSSGTDATANPFDPDKTSSQSHSPSSLNRPAATSQTSRPSSSSSQEPYTPKDVPVNLPDPEYYKTVKGWGIDADPDNDPTYSIKPNRTDDEQRGYTWQRPPQQDVNMEVLHSTERPNLSAVFGTSMPPSGLSGMLRRYAFQYSESSLGHWLPLVMADRINVFEGYLEDLSHGHIPNVFAERGWKAEWKHDPERVMQKVATGAVVTAALITMACRKRNRR
jgi:hypothetical protein